MKIIIPEDLSSIDKIWPVLQEVRKAAQNDPSLIGPWTFIAIELYRIPEDFSNLIERINDFVSIYNSKIEEKCQE